MQQKARVGALVAVALVGGVTLWRIGGNTSASPAAAHRSAESASPAPAAADRSAESPEAPPGPAAARRQPEGRRRAFDRLRADGIRQRAAGRSAAPHAKSAAAMAQAPTSAASASAAPPMTPEEAERRRVYIRDAVREQYFPIARSCYQELLDRKPTASGKIVLSFAIVGDDEDGVVDRVELDDDTTMDDPEFALCIRESMYSTIFEPPPPGMEETTVVYPIEFAPAESTPAPNPGKVEQTSR
jgi:hypothetical protein